MKKLKNELNHRMVSSYLKNHIEKRKHNIKVIADLPRTGLEFNMIERKLLLYTTESDEKVISRLS